MTHSTIDGIPSLNLRDFTHGSTEEQEAFVKALGTAYTDIGFVAISHHGIPDKTIEDLYAQSEEFFSLPPAVKASYARPEAHGQRGYVGQGVEHAKGSDEADLKEFWQVGQPTPSPGCDPNEFPPNQAVTELDLFKPSVVDAFQAMEATGQHMLRAIARFLGLDPNYFKPWVTGGNSILRAIHYPPIRTAPKDAVRAGQHEDINLITLLVGASADGLEVLRKDGTWIAVTALPDHIVVNVGDMLQRLTNHRLKSTTHRVVNPPQQFWHLPRFSMPFFLHPQSSMPLDALRQCIPAGTQPIEPPITAGAYLSQRLEEIGLKNK